MFGQRLGFFGSSPPRLLPFSEPRSRFEKVERIANHSPLSHAKETNEIAIGKPQITASAGRQLPQNSDALFLPSNGRNLFVKSWLLASV